MSANILSRVEHTNDYSIESKYSAVRKGYFKDEYIRHFFPDETKLKNRTSLVHRGYWIRHRAVEYAIGKINPDLLIYIGSGSDTLSLRHKEMIVIEVDLPHVMDRKIDTFKNCGLIDADGTIELEHGIRTDRMSLIKGDITKTECLTRIMDEIMNYESKLEVKTGGVPRICVYNECTLCYLYNDESIWVLKELMSMIKRDMPHAMRSYVGYEQLKPCPGHEQDFCHFMINHFESMGSPLRTLLDRDEMINRFKNVQDMPNSDVQVMDMNQFYFRSNFADERKRIEELEMFDEEEEFQLLLSTYGLTMASDESKDQMYHRSVDQLKRYSHCSCPTSDGQNILIFGGYRQSSSSDPLLIVTPAGHVDTVHGHNIPGHEKFAQMAHIKDGKYIISGGRKSPKDVSKSDFIFEIVGKNVVNGLKVSIDGNNYRHTLTRTPNGTKLIKIGGKTGQTDGRKRSVIKTFDDQLIDGLWNDCWTNFNHDVHSHASVCLTEDTILVSGGLNGVHGTFNDVQSVIIDLRSSETSTIEGIPFLYSHQMEQLTNNNLIAIVGGLIVDIDNNYKTQSNNCCFVYDVRNQQIVKKVDNIRHGNESIKMLHNMSMDSIDGHLLIVGGGGNCFTFGTHFNQFYQKIPFSMLLT